MAGIAADGDGKTNPKSLFVGRDKEINGILDKLKSKKGTRLLLVGESSIGKSAILDEIHRRLTEWDQTETLVGYYSKEESLIAESESLIYPFRIVLRNLVCSAKKSQQLAEKIDSVMAKVKNGLLKFGKEQGIKIGIALVEDLAKIINFVSDNTFQYHRCHSPEQGYPKYAAIFEIVQGQK